MGAQQSASSTDVNQKQFGVKEKSPTKRINETPVRQAAGDNVTKTEIRAAFPPDLSQAVQSSGKRKVCCIGPEKVTKDKGDLERASKTNKLTGKANSKIKDAKQHNFKDTDKQRSQKYVKEKYLDLQNSTENIAAQALASANNPKYQRPVTNLEKIKLSCRDSKPNGPSMREPLVSKTVHPTAIIKSMVPVATCIDIGPKKGQICNANSAGERNKAVSRPQGAGQQSLSKTEDQTRSSVVLAEHDNANAKIQAQDIKPSQKCELASETRHPKSSSKLTDTSLHFVSKETFPSVSKEPLHDKSQHMQSEDEKPLQKCSKGNQKSCVANGSMHACTSRPVDSHQVNVSLKAPLASQAEAAVSPVASPMTKSTSADQESSHSKVSKTKQKTVFRFLPHSAPARTENNTEAVVESAQEKLKRYVDFLREADEYHMQDTKLVVYWLLGRFLTNEEVSTKIIEKFCKLGHGAEKPQKMISHMLIHAFDNLNPITASFLLSEEHRFFKGLWIPNSIKAYPALQLFFKSSKAFGNVVRAGVRKTQEVEQKKEEKSVDHSMKSPAYDPKLPENLMRGRVTITVPDQTHVQGIGLLNGWDSKDSVQNTSENFKTNVFCGKISGSNEKGYRLESSAAYYESFAHQLALKARASPSCCLVPHIWSFAKAEAGGDTNEVAYDMEPLYQKNPYAIPPSSVNLTNILQRECKCVSCFSGEFAWPWTADCEKLISRVLCLAHVNTSVRRKQQKIDAGETESYKKAKGKRAKKGNAKVEEKEKPSGNETLKCEEQKPHFGGHRECEMFHEELEKKNVSAVGMAVTVFPLLDETSGSRIFFSGKNQKRNPKLIHDVFPLVLDCECSIKEKKSSENTSQFATRMFAKDQVHHHDSLVLDLFVPAHVKNSAGGEIANDTMHLLRILSRYVFQARSEVFSLTGTRISDKAIETHLRHVQSLCENVFRFIYFAEICGAAEMNMRGGYYLAKARSNYEEARDSAIEIGIYPTLVNMLNAEMAYLPSHLQFVKKPSMYLAALSFLNLRVPEITDAVVVNWLEDNQEDFVLEPIAVSMMETIAGKGYQHNIDDEIAYKALTGAGDHLGKGAAVALISPVDVVGSESVFRLFEFDRSEFTADRRTASQRLEMEERVKSLVQKISAKYVKNLPVFEDLPRSIAEKADFESLDDAPIWKHLLDIAESMQKKDFRPNVEVTEEQAKGGAADQSGEKTGNNGQSDPTNDSSVSSEQPKSSEDSVKPPAESQPKSSGDEAVASKPKNATETQEGEKATGKEGAKRKKPNREYLSGEKRKQRQARRLREKWEKKHKVESNASKNKQ